MVQHVWARFSAVLAILAAVLAVANAQVPMGSLDGIVVDAKDALVVGAHVTAVSATQGVTRATVTNGSGLYTISDLPPAPTCCASNSRASP
jgi:sugar lactone lactonase YvrE